MRRVLLALFVATAGCGHDELRLVNRTDHKVTIDVALPKVGLTPSCAKDFGDRFCKEQYEPAGILEVSAKADRLITVFEPSDQDPCANLLWMRLLKLDDVGPISDPGTLIELPAIIEVEVGAGPIHTAAFPQATVRIDEAGNVDEHQRSPPKPCAL